MSDGRGFMVTAYVLTVVTLSWYALLLGLRGRAVRCRLAATRRESRESQLHAVGGDHV